MKAMIVAFGETTQVEIDKSSYSTNGATALIATDAKTGQHYCKLSVNLVPYSNNIRKDQCFIKTQAENEGFLEQLVAQKVVKPTKVIDSGTGAVLVDILF